MANKVVIDPYYARVIFGDVSDNCIFLVFYSANIIFEAAIRTIKIMGWINSSNFIKKMTANAVVSVLPSVFTVVRPIMRR